MTRAQLRALQTEWYGKADALARTRGDRDIETPQGNIRGDGRRVDGKNLGRRELHIVREEDGSFELATEKRRFLHSYAFANAMDRSVWEMHADNMSAREIGRRLGKNRKTIDRWLARLTTAFQKRDAKPAHRPVDPDSLRSEGLRLGLVLLSPPAALAMDHIRARLNVSKAEAVRRGLLALAGMVT